ncbi:MAG: peptidyl-prolyl cis-trans isomerase [Blastocatellales bacterium]|nr:peptidyl-prolyl cis-trans isomerase [Blastocatellales bacterium]
MLRFFAKFQRSRNFLLLLFCFVLLIGLVIFYIPNYDFNPNAVGATGSEGQTVIAKVGSREITLKQYRNAIISLGSRFGQGNTLPMSTMRALGVDKDALDRLIDEKILLAEADRLSIRGTDSDVGDQVRRSFVDPDSGRFIGVEEYKRRLRLNGEDLGEYEQNLRDAAAIMKMRQYLGSAEQVSEREIEDAFKKENIRVDLVYAIIDLEKVRSTFKPTEAELRAFYDGRKDDFKVADPVRKVDYIFIPTDEVAKTLKLSEEDLRKEYEGNKQFEPRASIIKLNVLATADEATVRAKIDELNARVRGGVGGAPPEDFAAVARGNSQDASASKGGDLGFIKKDANRPNEWRQRAHSLKVGDIDGPFRDGSSWYIMKVTEQREVPFAEMRATVEAGLRNRRAYSQASQIADRAYEKAIDYKDLRKAAEEIGKEINLSADRLLRSTPFFKKGDTLPDIGSNPAFEDAVVELKQGDIGDKVGIPGGLAVPRVVEVREPGVQLTFEEARNMVEQKLRQEREPNLAQQKAQEFLSRSGSAKNLEALLKAEKIDVKSDTNFNTLTAPGAAQGGLQALQQAQAAARELKEGEIARAPIKFGAGYLIFGATKRVDADLSQLPAAREGLRSRLIMERQSMINESYIKAARKRYETENRITIYQDRIDDFFSRAQ